MQIADSLLPKGQVNEENSVIINNDKLKQKDSKSQEKEKLNKNAAKLSKHPQPVAPTAPPQLQNTQIPLQKKINLKTLVVQVSSAGFHAGDYAKISINNKPVDIVNDLFTSLNEYTNLRGLHLIIINPVHGEVLDSRTFDTYKSSAAFDEYIEKSKIP